MNVWNASISRYVRNTAARRRYLLRKKADLMILFTNTVSHKMVLSAVTEAKKNDVNIVRTHSSSAASLTSVLETYLSESRAC